MSYLGLDASTQSVSALILDAQTGKIAAQASVNFGESLPQYGAPQGFVEGAAPGEIVADPGMWLDALELVLAELRTEYDLSRIRVIGGAGQQHGSVYLNTKWGDVVAALDPNEALSTQLKPCLSRSLSPIWMDTSTSAQCAEINTALGGAEEVCRRSGSIAIERFTGPQIRRFAQTQPKAYAKTARIHLVSSFFSSVLAGKDAPIDHGDGAGMNLLNLETWEWDAGLLEATAEGLDARLPRVASLGQTTGTVATYFVEKYGFAPEAVVLPFTGDNPASLVGMGASEPGKVLISLGTSDTFFAALPTARTDPDGYGHVFGNPLGGTFSLQCFVNGSLAREAIRDQFQYTWEQFDAGLKATPAGNNGNLMFPSIRPEISPRMDREAPVMQGAEVFLAGKDPAASVRAAVEGQMLNMRNRIAWMGLEPRALLLTGGAAQNDAIAQVIADVFQLPVQRLGVGNSVALGAALLAAHHDDSALFQRLEATLCAPDVSNERKPATETATVYAQQADALEAVLQPHVIA